MKVRNPVGEQGKVILEYVSENEQDREQLLAMMLDGEIPNEPIQRDRKAPQGSPLHPPSPKLGDIGPGDQTNAF
jgi:hypothetical protein